MGKFLDEEGLKSLFCRQFCKRFDHHLRASSGFQAFFAEILAGQILQRSHGTSLQLRYPGALMRNSLKYVPWKLQREVVADLKPIYAVTITAVFWLVSHKCSANHSLSLTNSVAYSSRNCCK